MEELNIYTAEQARALKAQGRWNPRTDMVSGNTVIPPQRPTMCAGFDGGTPRPLEANIYPTGAQYVQEPTGGPITPIIQG
ncbi:hypothetical protein GF362_07335 [Candidatus Dojkabacteria bacterium]|nr:hypothetical protein [Candidatus Dojkabacteria bacterium]